MCIRDSGLAGAWPWPGSDRLDTFLIDIDDHDATFRRLRVGHAPGSVSYTHLDVYKRQGRGRPRSGSRGARRRPGAGRRPSVAERERRGGRPCRRTNRSPMPARQKSPTGRPNTAAPPQGKICKNSTRWPHRCGFHGKCLQAEASPAECVMGYRRVPGSSGGPLLSFHIEDEAQMAGRVFYR